MCESNEQCLQQNDNFSINFNQDYSYVFFIYTLFLQSSMISCSFVLCAADIPHDSSKKLVDKSNFNASNRNSVNLYINRKENRRIREISF